MRQREGRLDTSVQGGSSREEGEPRPPGWLRTLARQRHSRLGRKLLASILLFSMTLALAATLVQLLYEYQWDVSAIHARLSEIERTRVKSVANSLWEFDRALTAIQLEEILQLPDIARVELDTTLGERFSAGDQRPSSATITQEYSLFSPQQKGLRLGTLRVVASLQGVYTRLWNNALVILATQSIKTIFVSLFILLLVHALVTRRLSALATETRKFDVAALDPPRSLVRESVDAPDELDDLAFAFHEMSVSLKRAFRVQERLALDNASLLADAQRELSERIRTEDELRRSQEMFLQAQKMEALGRLVVGVAHDFNNLLSVVIGNSDLILYSLKPNDPKRLVVSHIAQAGERGAALIRQLLAFGRRQLMRPAPIEVHDTVQGLMPILQQLSGERVAVVSAPSARSHWVYADRMQLEQVLMNLVVNARDATPGDGTVTISCEEVAESQADGQGVSEYVALVVSDTGIGMDEATQARMFEPFFTTKESGRGTGLGLATVAGIVAQSGGQIRTKSTQGLGTTFTILLPRIAAPTPALATEHAPVGATSLAPGDVRVLLVDDDELVRDMAANALRHGGYAVVEAADADEALKLAYAGTGHIELVLSDVGLPRVSGVELVRRLRARLPGVKVVLMSGYAQELRHLGGDSQVDGFLEKPFGPAALLAKVREVLTTSA